MPIVRNGYASCKRPLLIILNYSLSTNEVSGNRHMQIKCFAESKYVYFTCLVHQILFLKLTDWKDQAMSQFDSSVLWLPTFAFWLNRRHWIIQRKCDKRLLQSVHKMCKCLFLLLWIAQRTHCIAFASLYIPCSKNGPSIADTHNSISYGKTFFQLFTEIRFALVA